MDENLVKIKAMLESSKFTGNTSDEFLFTVNCVDYFFYSKNIGQSNILDGFTDGAHDGGIDFIYDDGEKMYLIQGKSQVTITYNEVRDLFAKMKETAINFKNGNTDEYNDRLKSAYKSTLDNLNDPEIEFVLFTNAEIDKSLVNKIDKLNKEGDFSDYHLVAYGCDEIANKVVFVDGDDMTIEQGELELENTQMLSYQSGKGAIFTIKAFSLKELYEKKKTKGLFGYNLREQISQASVDDEIDKTIKDAKDNFWYYNNGITIGCSDYDKDGNKLKLYDFSIINGAQTTSKIGKSTLINKDNDFALVCKVIKSEKSLDDEFIRKVSEASNSQKPIKFRDLKSNAVEQKMLQNNFANNGKYKLAVEIKRGVKAPNYRILETWQRVTNEDIGQILLATQYQKPGTARSNKAEIFGKQEMYNLLFSKDKVKNYDYNTIYDFVRLSHYYDNFKVRYTEAMNDKMDDASTDAEKKEIADFISVCKNAKFVTIALIAYLIKKLYFKVSDTKDDNYDKPIIKGNLSLSYSDENYFELLDALFEFIVDKLNTIYNSKISILKLTSHSNFFKTDLNYKEHIIPEFDRILTKRFEKDNILIPIAIFDDEENCKILSP